ncbi:MAG: hypothetical protein Q4D59_00970 [Erysipelotrichaceae bacterium]|nr:hypothetical protein [Erysipelotrichaceae bacterium]
MDERDLRILDRAIEYTSRLANGVNPLNNTRVSPNDVVNQEKIKAYLQYVEQVLRKYRYDQLNPTVYRKNTIPFSIKPEQLRQYQYFQEPVTASVICKAITDLAATEGMQAMKAQDVSAWLLKEGYLQEIPYGNKTAKIPTEKGEAAGIYGQEAVNAANENYIRLTYGPKAQELIVRNIDRVIGSYTRPSSKQNNPR